LNFSRFPFFLIFLLCLGGALCLPATASWALQARISCTLIQPSSASAAFIKESRIEFVNANKLHRRSLQAGDASPAVAAPQPDKQTASTPRADAAEHGSGQDEGNDVYRHSTSVQLLARWLHMDKESAARLFEYLNFAILAGAILYALSKYLPKRFRENRKNIQQRLLDARTATEQAHERLAAIEQRLGRLDEEIAAIRKQAEKDSVEDEARIKATIEEERRRIVDATSKDIAAASSAAQRDLKRFAAGLAVDRAAQRIVLTEDDDRGLLQEFAQSLGQHAQGRGES
jgi:F-type H+-transporting ATPase subunit b